MEPIKTPEIKYTQLFINNQFVDSASGELFSVKTPITGQEIAKVHSANAADVDKAVKAAAAAFDRNSDWRKMNASQRGELLYRFSELLQRDKHYLASLESYNSGKVINDAYEDLDNSVKTLRFYAGAADKVNGQVLPADGNNFSYTVYEPVGVCAAITPWNYPIYLAILKIAPCLAMGNTLVLKPSELTPLTILAVANLIKEAGIPAGVVNIVPGYGPTAGMPCVQHPLVRKVTFTGSTVTGKLIYQEASKSLKRVTLELGGKSPFIIFPDADLDKAAQVAHACVMINEGQCCCAATRTFVHEDVYDEFVAKCVALAKKRVVGDPRDTKTQHGPQVDERQFNKVLGLIESGVKEGAKLECGGKRHGNVGYFIEPTVFSNVTDDMTIAKQEIFGPVQQILKFSTVDEVIRRANDTNYGLAAGVMTNNMDTAFKVSSRLDAGQVYVNNYLTMGVHMPFGGFKESGIGREFGLEGMRQFSEVKCVMIDLPFKVI